MPIPIRVISLARSEARRAAITAHLATLGLAPQFFDAVDGYAMTPEEIREMRPGISPRYGTPLNPGQIGSAASYRRLCLEIAAATDPYACILEDDAILSPTVIDTLDEAYLATLPRFDILRLGHGGSMRPHFQVAIAKGKGFAVVAPLFPLGLAFAQIVSRDGAAKIAAGLVPLRAAADTFIFNDARIPNLRIMHTDPPLARETGHTPSTIDTERNWPKARGLAHLTTRWARVAAVGRNIENYRRAWGSRALMQSLMRRSEPVR